MIRAILAGRKTQTRRPIKPRGKKARMSLFNGQWADSYVLDPGNATWRERDISIAVGAKLWVREAHRFITDTGSHRWDGAYQYRADGVVKYGEMIPGVEWARRNGEPKDAWRSSIHMPRYVSRLTLTVTDVRVMRLMSITEEDAMAEGAEPTLVPPDGGSAPHVEGFRQLWNSIHGPDADFANPLVAAYTFTVAQRNIDA